MKKEKMEKGMIDNRMVHDNHQEGIERVKQRSGSMPVGEPGKMSATPKEHANWKRSGGSLTPRRG